MFGNAKLVRLKYTLILDFGRMGDHLMMRSTLGNRQLLLPSDGKW